MLAGGDRDPTDRIAAPVGEQSRLVAGLLEELHEVVPPLGGDRPDLQVRSVLPNRVRLPRSPVLVRDRSAAEIAWTAGNDEARVVFDMAEADLEAGDILVTAYTDPSWTPAFVAIAGLHATRLIRDGQRIRLHGTAGYVELLPGPAAAITRPPR